MLSLVERAAEDTVATFQLIGLYLIMSLNGGDGAAQKTPGTIVKVGSFKTTADCLNASRAAVFGKSDAGAPIQKSFDFVCIPEASPISWGVASEGSPSLTIRRLN